MIIGLFVLTVLLVLAGLLIDGGRIILSFNKLFQSTHIAAEANLGSYDRELWKTKREVKLDFPLSEMIVRDVLYYNMKEADIVFIVPISQSSIMVRTESEVPIVLMQKIAEDKWKLQSETSAFVIE